VTPERGRPTSVDLDDLDELRVVTKRAFRRGYQAQVNGRLTRLRYRKIMDTEGGVLVHRPAAGEERPKRLLWGVPRALLILALGAWPLTMLVLLGIVVMVTIGIRALLNG
jgi:hypothetical protein